MFHIKSIDKSKISIEDYKKKYASKTEYFYHTFLEMCYRNALEPTLTSIKYKDLYEKHKSGWNTFSSDYNIYIVGCFAKGQMPTITYDDFENDKKAKAEQEYRALLERQKRVSEKGLVSLTAKEQYLAHKLELVNKNSFIKGKGNVFVPYTASEIRQRIKSIRASKDFSHIKKFHYDLRATGGDWNKLLRIDNLRHYLYKIHKPVSRLIIAEQEVVGLSDKEILSLIILEKL